MANIQANANGQHTRVCFCFQRCREASLVTVMAEATDEEELFREYFTVLPRQIDKIDERKFNKTKRLVLYGNALRIISLAGTGYISYGAWLATTHGHLSLAERKKKSDKISWAKTVFERWDEITANMANINYTNISIKRFTLQQLHRAISPKWCEEENERQAPKEAKRKKQNVVPNFSMQKFSNIVNYIRGTEIVNDVSGDEEQLKLLSQMLFDELKIT